MRAKQRGFTPLESVRKQWSFVKYNGNAAMSSKTLTGFTLVELLVVIAIIGILSTLLLLQLNSARAKARDTKRIADVNQIRTALEQYYDANGMFPQTLSDSDAAWTQFFSNKKTPTDPSDSAAYIYNVNANPATKYQVSAQLEQKNANALSSDSDVTSSDWSGATDGSIETCAGRASCIFDLGIR